jgi:hypothetical protein
MVSDFGDTESEKSGVSAVEKMVAVTVAELLRSPEVPTRVTITLPAAAVEAAVSVTFCAVPEIRVSVAGFAVTPVGSPVMATITVPVKPFTGTAFTLICCPAPPATSVTLTGVEVSKKPGIGTEFEGRWNDPLQEIKARQKNRQAAYAIAGRPCLGSDVTEVRAASVAEGGIPCRGSDFTLCKWRPRAGEYLAPQTACPADLERGGKW